MSNPYTQPSISGYNASPPADDGTEVSANQLKWSNHKTKLADPLKTFIEGVDTATLAAFGLVFGAAVLAKTANYTVTTADRGRFITVTGTSTITLPVAATAGSGFPLLIVNIGSAVVTIDGDSSETINGSVTQTLNTGGAAIITSNGSAWTGVIINPASTQTKYKTANESLNSSTTLQDDDHLAGFTMEADEVYRVNGHLSVTSAATPDTKIGVSFSNTPQYISIGVRAADDSGNTSGDAISNTASTLFVPSSGNTDMVEVSGVFKANATTGGTFDLQWAQNTSDASPTLINQGSWLRIEKIS